MSQKIKPGHVLVEVVQGVEGPSLSIGDNDTGERVAGPKPWGGGRTIHSFQVAAKDLVRLAKEYAGAEPVAPVERDVVQHNADRYVAIELAGVMGEYLAMPCDSLEARMRDTLRRYDSRIKAMIKAHQGIPDIAEPSAPTGFDYPGALRLLSADHCKECGHPDCNGQCYGDDMMGDS